MGKKGKNQAAREAKKQKQAAKAGKKLLKDIEEEIPIQDLVKQFDNTSTLVSQSEIKASTVPSARTNFSFLSGKGGVFYIFGGEYFDNKACQVFRDLYKWIPGKEEEEWRLIKCIVEPKPRCGHQAVLYQDEILVFGGEFATTSQFYHFRDFWSFDLKSNTWTKVQCTGTSPSARSGHRMVMCRGLLVLFGGFHDSNKETRYFNDVYVYARNVWRKITFQAGVTLPAPRSGVVAAADNNGVFIYGGYAKVKDTDSGAQGQTFQDGWWLDMTPVFDDFKNGIPVWERLGRKGTPPLRNGCGVAVYKSNVLVFGGVIDDDTGGLTLKASLFFNDIFVYEMTSRKWSPLIIGEKKKLKDDPGVEAAVDEAEGVSPKRVADTRDIHQRYGYICNHGKLQKVIVDPVKPFERRMNAPDLSHMSKKERAEYERTHPTHDFDIVDDDYPWKINPKKANEPLPRMGASVCVKDNYIYIYGGNLEVENSTIVLDDCWRLHLGKKSKWELMLPGTYWSKDWEGSESSSSTEDEVGSSASSSEEWASSEDEEEESSDEEVDRSELIQDTLGPCSPERIPLEGESLRDYFGRTKGDWVSEILGTQKSLAKTEKAIHQEAFLLASNFYDRVQKVLSDDY